MIRKIISKLDNFIPRRSVLGHAGVNANIAMPVYMAYPKAVFMEENTVIRHGTKIINAPNERVTIKKYTVVSVNCTIVPNGHRSTVGIPQVLLGASHINDKSNDLVIGEDVWIGANVTILSGANLGRGCICGACSMITKPVPPYALVVGSPAKIVGVKFTIDQIIEHEKILYPEDERMTRDELYSLFEKYYKDKKVFGVQTAFGEKELDMLNAAIKQREFLYADEYISKLKVYMDEYPACSDGG